MTWRDGRKERLYRRYEVDDVKGSLHFKQEVRVLNMSAGGMQVETGSHLAIGRRYTFRLQQASQDLQVAGMVAWCKLSGTRKVDDQQVEPTYTAGISFEQSLSTEGQALVSFLEGVTLELHHRIFGRFPAQKTTSADIDTVHEFRVERLSQSGMLISTDFLPPVEAVLSLEIRFDEEVFGSDGRVAFIRDLHDEDGQVEIGIEFMNTSAEHLEILKGFLARELADSD